MMILGIFNKVALTQVAIAAAWLLIGVIIHKLIFKPGVEDKDTFKVLYFWVPYILVGVAIIFFVL